MGFITQRIGSDYHKLGRNAVLADLQLVGLQIITIQAQKPERAPKTGFKPDDVLYTYLQKMAKKQRSIFRDYKRAFNGNTGAK